MIPLLKLERLIGFKEDEEDVTSYKIKMIDFSCFLLII